MEDSRYNWIDTIRATACLLVILLHVSAMYLYKYNTIPIQDWMVGNLIDSITRVSVPLFFMISGFLFLGDKTPRYVHFKKVFLSLLFYSVIAIIYIPLSLKISNPSDAINWQLPSVSIFNTPPFYHLWFFYALIPVYLIACLVATRKISLKYIIILFLILFVFINEKTNHILLLFGVDFKSNLQINSEQVYYLLYAIMGSLIGKTYHNNDVKLKITYGFIFLLSSLLTAIGTLYLTKLSGKYNGTFYAYSSPLVAIAAFSLFSLLKISNISNRWFFPFVIKTISKYSLSIFGIHAFILDIINRFNIRIIKYPIIDISIVFIFVLLTSLLLSLIIKKIDYKGYVS